MNNNSIKYAFYESTTNDPSYNLAIEEFFFKTRPVGELVFMLWQNNNTIVVGKYQNAAQEINHEFVQKHGINVVRRMSGGGAVYHDLGNINYTIISDYKDNSELDFSVFCAPVIRALKTCGVTAETSGRNDILIDGKKFSGTAQHASNGRIMHHGCVMFDTDLTVVSHALNVNYQKYSSKAAKSVSSRVTNIREHISEDITLDCFKKILKEEVLSNHEVTELSLSAEDWAEIKKIRNNKYGTWEWNIGQSPTYGVVNTKRFDTCGTLELGMNIDKGGIITDAKLCGDFFGNDDANILISKIIGCPIKRDEISAILCNEPIGYYITNITAEELVDLICE